MENPWEEIGKIYEKEEQKINLEDTLLSQETEEIKKTHGYELECCYCECEAEIDDEVAFYGKHEQVETYYICNRCNFFEFVLKLPFIKEIEKKYMTETISNKNYLVENWKKFKFFMNENCKIKK